jgi:single-strand DNA-binding protein
MADLNQVMMIGRLTRDTELKYAARRTAVCGFSIAVNRKRRNGDKRVDKASFFEAALWGRQAEALSRYLVKGKQIGYEMLSFPEAYNQWYSAKSEGGKK